MRTEEYQMIDVFGTLGPSCSEEEVLRKMFEAGMTGIRINLSHTMLKDCSSSLENIRAAALSCGITPKLLIDMQGPELRIGSLSGTLTLKEGDELILGKGREKGAVPLDKRILAAMKSGREVLLDDGRISAKVLTVSEDDALLKVTRGGSLFGRKSIAIVGTSVDMPALTDNDLENIKLAEDLGITGIMQPFVRSADDLSAVREALDANGGKDISIYAKIENTAGVANLESFFEYADEIVIARGDLGNAVPLWELPGVQKDIAKRCNAANMPFMVVTQMLASMEHSKVPTRAEVSDIYNAVLDGAHSVMVTGETAVGDYPVEVISYLKKTACAAYEFI